MRKNTHQNHHLFRNTFSYFATNQDTCQAHRLAKRCFFCSVTYPLLPYRERKEGTRLALISINHGFGDFGTLKQLFVVVNI